MKMLNVTMTKIINKKIVRNIIKNNKKVRGEFSFDSC